MRFFVPDWHGIRGAIATCGVAAIAVVAIDTSGVVFPLGVQAAKAASSKGDQNSQGQQGNQGNQSNTANNSQKQPPGPRCGGNGQGNDNSQGNEGGGKNCNPSPN